MKNDIKMMIAAVVILVALFFFAYYASAEAFTPAPLMTRFPASHTTVGSQMTDLEMCNSGMVFQHRDENWCNHYRLLDVLKKLLVVLER